jgi:general secretion pathway protein L
VTLSELLNADLSTVGPWLRDGFAWWLEELAGMLPAPARRWFETRPALCAEPVTGGGYRLTRNGRVVMEPAGAAPKSRPVALRLARDEMLIREAPAPRVPDRDLRRMLELDVDRLTPFRPDQVFVDVVPREADGAGPRRAVVAAIPRERALEAVARARAAGLDPRALGVASPDPAELALDFLPRMRQAGAVERPSVSRALVWGAVAVLAAANLGAAIGRDILDVRGLRRQVDAQRGAVNQALGLRRQVMDEQRRRADILLRRERGEPLRMLDAVTGAVPNGAWVERLAWDGRTVRVAGYRRESVDVAAAMRSAPLLSEVRNSGADLLNRQAAGQPFDLTAELGRSSGE